MCTQTKLVHVCVCLYKYFIYLLRSLNVLNHFVLWLYIHKTAMYQCSLSNFCSLAHNSGRVCTCSAFPVIDKRVRRWLAKQCSAIVELLPM